MAQVILQPASGVHPSEHYANTIARPVPLPRIRSHVSGELFSTLEGLYPEGAALVWGATPGPVNARSWDRMESGAIVLFYKEGRFISSAQLTLKTRNRALARELWGTDDGGNTWELMFFLKDLRPQRIQYDDLWKTVRVGPSSMLRGLTVLDATRSDSVLGQFDLRRQDLENQAQDDLLEAVDLARSASRGQRFAISKEQRKALELHAMQTAERKFASAGYRVEDVSSWSPYDLRCSRGDEVLYVEVKGTTTRGEEVLLTPNEVKFAREHKKHMVLFVVHSIEVTGERTDPQTSGGILREVHPWDIETGVLAPTGFLYTI